MDFKVDRNTLPGSIPGYTKPIGHYQSAGASKTVVCGGIPPGRVFYGLACLISFEGNGKMCRENLKQARKTKGMTQQAVAEYLPVSLSHYKNIESGKRIGSIEIWDKLESLFNIHQRELRAIQENLFDKEENP